MGIKPWLWLPPATAHRLSPLFLEIYGRVQPLQTLTWLPWTWRDLEFNNRLGLAGGIDKDATHIQRWWTLGPGFIEIGTVTPRAQVGHLGKVFDRDRSQSAVWNRLGFPSKGVDFVANQLTRLYQPHFTPIFANIGKNKETPLERAHEDYLVCMQKLAGLVDAFVVNVSSPNTQGLRDLLMPENLKKLLAPLVESNQRASVEHSAPILLKVSPDLSDQELRTVLDVSLEMGIDGWILANSSSGLRDGLDFPSEGGVSGRPLAATAKHLLTVAADHLGSRRLGKLLISAGGVIDPQDVFERLELGADLVQVYSALIFNGPFFFRQVAEKAALRPF